MDNLDLKDNNSFIKEKLKNLKDCKDYTITVGDKFSKFITDKESLKQIVNDFSICLKTIEEIEPLKNSEQLRELRDGIKYTKMRIISEKNFITSVIENENNDSIQTHTFTLSIIRKKEEQVWKTIQKKVTEQISSSKPKSALSDIDPIMWAWFLFVIFPLILIFLKNGNKNEVTSKNNEKTEEKVVVDATNKESPTPFFKRIVKILEKIKK